MSIKRILTELAKEVYRNEVPPHMVEMINELQETIRFKPPSLENVMAYMGELELTYAQNEAERFCNFYTSKGWMIGKNKMKDWKAAVRNWAKDKPKRGRFVP